MTADSLIARRNVALGPVYRLFYDEPVHLVRGEGVWLWDVAGGRYLDCYNNVASVGHCHPRVVEAVHRQMQKLNTHTRYLHDNVVLLAERLGALLPEDLSVCMFVCTGTEANDLAVQMARAVTGNHGMIVSEASYHGNSTLVRALSTESYPAAGRPEWLGVVEPPDLYRGPYRAEDPDAVAKYLANADDAISRIGCSGHRPAALMLDTVWDAPGPLSPTPDYVQGLCRRVRDAGGLVIADEVQAGHCRTGDWWGFEAYEIVPDIVTMGKPAGNGHPLAVVATTPEIAKAFARRGSYFNTFGGNPVSAAAGLAVLDVIEEERLGPHVKDCGSYFRGALERLVARHPVIGLTRGRGMFLGLDLVSDVNTRQPLCEESMRRITTRLMQEGILTASTGRWGNVLKLRPPLPFDRSHADLAVSAIDRVLAAL